jgi:hypothetical protein
MGDEVLERLKVLINSSTPIVVIETIEEVRAVNLVRHACAELDLPTFEWTIADGLVRSGSVPPNPPAARTTSNGAGNSAAMYNSREPVQALATIESFSTDAVFILKDFHRHIEDAVIVRRLRDVGQKFSVNRRTLVITAPALSMPPELAGLVEYLDIPLPGPQRLREIIDETFARLSRSYTLKRKLDASGLDAMAGKPAWLDGRGGRARRVAGAGDALRTVTADRYRCSGGEEGIAAPHRDAGVR